MRKFTVFTVILTVIIVVVVAEIAVNEYLPALEGDAELTLDLPKSLDLSKSIETNVLGNNGLTNYLGADYSGESQPTESATARPDELATTELDEPSDASLPLTPGLIDNPDSPSPTASSP